MRKGLAVAAGLLILTGINWTIVQREHLLREGRVVLLELAPVDPRSLMQGDYMALRYQLVATAFGELDASTPADGYVLVTPDAHEVAQFRRRVARDEPMRPAADELTLRYRLRNGVVQFATNAFFFQEGTAARYESARYGEFRVGADGEMLLTGLRDADFQRLGAPDAPP